MGRFRMDEADEDDNDDDDDNDADKKTKYGYGKEWQFVGPKNESENAAMVVFAKTGKHPQEVQPEQQPGVEAPPQCGYCCYDNNNNNPRDTMVNNSSKASDAVRVIRDLYADNTLNERYHNHYNHGDNHHHFVGGCCNLFRLSIVITTLLGILCHAYLPPAPPPPSLSSTLSATTVDLSFRVSESETAKRGEDDDDDEVLMSTSSWRYYLQSHSRQILESTKALVIDTPFHILSWLSIALYKDLQSTYYSKVTATSTDCSWQIPRSIDIVQRDLSTHVLGQALAVEYLAEAMVGWDHNTKNNPLSILAIGSKSTGKKTLAQAIISLYAPTTCGPEEGAQQLLLIIPKDDPRTIRQLRHRIRQHIYQFPQASMILYYDERLDYTNNDNAFDKAENVIWYRLSHTLGGTIMAQHLRARNWGSPTMLADLRAELLNDNDNNNNNNQKQATVILPFAPMTPTVLAAIVQHHKLDDEESTLLLNTVEYMDWTTKEGELIMRVAIEGAQGLPWNRIRALQAARNKEEETSSLQ